MSERSRLPWAALGFALAAAFSSWNPLSAPFGLLTGVAALAIGIRALRRGGSRGPSIAAVALSAAAILASTLVLGLTAGVGRNLAGAEIVPAPGPGEASAELDEAAERTRASRERARRELEALGGGKGEGTGRRDAPPR